MVENKVGLEDGEMVDDAVWVDSTMLEKNGYDWDDKLDGLEDCEMVDNAVWVDTTKLEKKR